MNEQTRCQLAERQAGALRSEWGLGSAEAIRLKSLLLKLGILTAYRPLSKKFSGMSLRDSDGGRFMLINSNDTIGRQHFSIAHELYHLYVDPAPQPHVYRPGEPRDESEKNADMFASTLLMPSGAILSMLPEAELREGSVTLASVVKLEQYFAVSHRAMLLRLRHLNLIKKAAADEMADVNAKEIARSLGYDTSLYKSGNAGVTIGTDLGAKAKALFEKGRISEGHYIEVLNQLTGDGNARSLSGW